MCGFIKFWHYPSKSCLTTITDKQIEPLNIDFNPGFDKFAVCGYGEAINLYDYQTKKLIRTLESRYNFITNYFSLSRDSTLM